ncbi:S8 family serine peptidase [Clostridium felsineum]|uniref:Serine protease AprX n=1 Tax=Clostridium felsineum TaxID=36839 RepID=A0A1S8KYB9_9CLOT|nr:S8 family serine peptidase [Clostridium felsineum]URZ09769.1 Serine protease AprX [Clostridium felsineum]
MINKTKITNEVKVHLSNNKREDKALHKVIISLAENYTIKDLVVAIKKLPSVDLNLIENTEYFVFAKLTNNQLELLEHIPEVKNVWLDRKVEKMDYEVLKTINEPSFLYGGADFCNDITWAVLDDGIDKNHNALKYSNVVDVDLTGEGPIGAHGTYVAGIIAGWDPSNKFSGVAPKCQLYNFKVYGKNSSNWVSICIKAMEQIRNINKKANKLVIQGANLSLGISNEINVKEFNTGHSPICEEANRLVESGVIVCVAAGNYGAQAFEVPGDNSTQVWANFEMISVTDPGNAEKVITVGSTHKTEPELYGVSSFSSKGPTGDGRIKPDLVAPGEEVSSTAPNNIYTTASGTSAATPFVSGAAAQLIKAYPNLIGNPMKVKNIIMDSCKDLKRDPNFQGRGVLDLAKAIELAKKS